jgi:hypothetical protein
MRDGHLELPRRRPSDSSRLPRHAPARQDPYETPLRMSMSLQDAEWIDAQLIASRGSPSSTVLRELLWLRAVFLEQQRRIPVAERYRFEQRADRILAQLWATTPSVCPSETTITVGRNGKR